LYLLGFGLFRSLNAMGMVDALLPYEWIDCSVLGFCCLFLSFLNCLGFEGFLKTHSKVLVWARKKREICQNSRS